MKILIVGSGGREHAIAWKVAQSKLCSQLFIAPGNPGTARLGNNIDISADDVLGLSIWAQEKGIDLAIIGPEAPLAAGLADELVRNGIRVFGPSRAAAQIESSKVFAKNFMERYNIPTAKFVVFSNYDEAAAYLERVDHPVVIKASGLAAGKGVFIPDTNQEALDALRAMLVRNEFGPAGSEVIIEERLTGEEISLMAFTDGKSVEPMLPAQDHKRLADGDQGPNTGGMGAYAPVPGACPPPRVKEITRMILEPTVRGLAAEGMPYVGVLYAGLILTGTGPRVLEFNCRFGDPETQAILPLLDSDLVVLALACAEGKLDQTTVRWKPGSATCVVVASPGYPGHAETGELISGLETEQTNTMVFHAGTRQTEEGTVSAGGRVLGVTGWGSTLEQALNMTYQRVAQISLQGMQYRRDIGWRALKTGKFSAYRSSGVNIDAGNEAIKKMVKAVRSTYTPEVLAGIGSFGGLFDAAHLKSMENPVLVASTDGVGTKVKLAAEARRFAPIGMDIVNHCINDILVQGAHPLFFLDYIATSHLDPDTAAQVVSGISSACLEAGCTLLGGETAEMPGVYMPGEFDVAGTIVGVVERNRILPRDNIAPGDALIGLPSSGPHTNGYSLIRKVFAGVPLDTVYPELGISLVNALLAPHRSYLPVLRNILSSPDSPVKALAHLTGGGFIENIPRVLPEGIGAHIFRGNWQVSPLFNLIQKRASSVGISIDTEEMYRVFNMGIGMVVVVNASDADAFIKDVGDTCWVIGELVKGERQVTLV